MNAKVIGIFSVVILVAPIIVNVLMMIPTPITVGDHSHWISFYGSYTGGIIGGLFTMFGVIYTLKQGEKKEFVETYNVRLKHVEDLNDDLIQVKGFISEEEKGNDQRVRELIANIIIEYKEDMLDAAISIDYETYIATKTMLEKIRLHNSIIQGKSLSSRLANSIEIKRLYNQLKTTEEKMQKKLETYMK